LGNTQFFNDRLRKSLQGGFLFAEPSPLEMKLIVCSYSKKSFVFVEVVSDITLFFGENLVLVFRQGDVY